MKPPRRSCVDQFIRISPDLKCELFHVIENFHLSLGDRFNNAALTSQVKTVILKIRDEMMLAGPLGGLLFDMNLYNLWTLLKNYKTKQKAEVANRNACAFMAPFITRFLIDRMLFTLDRIMWTAPCSGLMIPKRLACAIFRLSMDVRKKTTGNCKFSGCGRKQLMGYAKGLVETFYSLDEAGVIGADLKRFFQLHCQFTNIDRLLTPVLDCCAGREPNLSMLTNHWFQRRDYRSISRSSSHAGQSLNELDNPFLLTDEEGNLRVDVCDLSPLLPTTQSPAISTLQMTTAMSAIAPGPTFVTQALPQSVSLTGPITILSRSDLSDLSMGGTMASQTGLTGGTIAPSIVPSMTPTVDSTHSSRVSPQPQSQSLLQFLQAPFPVPLPPLSPPSPQQSTSLNLKRKAHDQIDCLAPKVARTEHGKKTDCTPIVPEAETNSTIQQGSNAHALSAPETIVPATGSDPSDQYAIAAVPVETTATLPSVPNIIDLSEIENSGDFQPLPTENLTLFSECDLSPESCVTLGIPGVPSLQVEGQPSHATVSPFIDTNAIMTEEENNYNIDDELTQILFNLFESGSSGDPTKQ